MSQIIIFLRHIESIIQLSIVQPSYKREVLLFIRLFGLLIVYHGGYFLFEELT